MPEWTAWIRNESLVEVLVTVICNTQRSRLKAINYVWPVITLWKLVLNCFIIWLCFSRKISFLLLPFFTEIDAEKTLNCSSEHIFLASLLIGISGHDDMVIKICPGHIFGYLSWKAFFNTTRWDLMTLALRVGVLHQENEIIPFGFFFYAGSPLSFPY